MAPGKRQYGRSHNRCPARRGGLRASTQRSPRSGVQRRQAPFKQLQIAHGYDNNWVLNGYPGYRLVAVAQDLKNGVTLWAYTDQPGVQMYSGNFLVGDLIGTGGNTYRQGDGFTLETRHYPDGPHHINQSGWPSVVLNSGAAFDSTTAYQFGLENRSFKDRVHFH